MWQAGNSKSRTHKRKERQKPRLKLRLRRVDAELKISSGQLGAPALVVQARVLLNDISAQGVGIFCIGAIDSGTIVGITLEQPRRLFVRGRVNWCQPMPSAGAIIAPETFEYRIGIEFVFENPEEETEIKKYCEEIARHLDASKIK